MFRKVQLKFFGIITSILLAIFIAVLGSVNIIMETVMEHQTQTVLEQVAAGVGYDGGSGRFFIERPDDVNWQKFDDFPREEPPPKPQSETSAVPTTQSASTAVETTTAEVTTTELQTESTAVQPVQTTASPVVQDVPTTECVVESDAPTTAEPTAATTYRITQTTEAHPHHTETPTTAAHPDQNECQPGWDQWGPWGPWMPYDPWMPPSWWNGGHINDDYCPEYRPEHEHEHETNEAICTTSAKCCEQEWIFSCMANKELAPVLDGYTVLNDASSTRTTAASAYQERDTAPHEPAPKKEEYDEGSIPRTLGFIDFFVIMADENGRLLGIQNNDEMTEAVAQQYVNEILDRKADFGMANCYQFCAEKKDNGTLMVFTDKSAEINMMKKLKRTTIIVGLISIVILSAAAYFLSGLIVRPIKVAFDKQKQFVSDASHELKTPLTVISANADVLAGEIGENKWLTYIQDQAERMNVLVNDLLNLTRLENNSNFISSEFDLSKAVANTALPFECRAFEAGKSYILDIEEGIRITGSEQHIKQMAAIFIDNALKYSKEKGTVRVSLTSEGSRVRFSVYNTGSGLKESEKEKIFERFFRSDASRNRATGGYGLGLAIAKSIIDRHKFKLFVDNAEGKSVCFVVTMT